MCSNMKCFIFICVVLGLFSTRECMSDAEKEMLLQLHQKCQESSGVTDDMAQRALAGDFSDDPSFKEHILCISKGMGFFTESGEVNMDNVESQLNSRITDEALRAEIKSKCLQPMGTPQESAFHSAKCLFGYKDLAA